MELYLEQGYDQTTVAEIAERAGLTERTFFRHFADKREVLFGGSEHFHAHVLAAVEATNDADPIARARAGMLAACNLLSTYGRGSKQRAAVIASSPELTERELSKLAALSRAVADALATMGTEPELAELVAEQWVGVFKVAFSRWVSTPGDEPLEAVFHRCAAKVPGAPPAAQ